MDSTSNTVEELIERIKREQNKLLLKTGYTIDIYETSELYTDCEEDSPFYNSPTYEGHLMNKDESPLDDTFTGRYCDPSSVIDELEEEVAKFIENFESKTLLNNGTFAEKIGEDYWNRGLYLYDHGKKAVSVDGTLYTMSGEYGEPCCPLKDEFQFDDEVQNV